MSYLTGPEAQALLAAPDRTTRYGRRDHALLLPAVQTGLRVSEMTALTPGHHHHHARRPVHTTAKAENNAPPR